MTTRINGFAHHKTAKSVLIYIGSLALLSLSACASIPELPEGVASQPIEPIPKPDWTVGMSTDMINLESDEAGGSEIVEVLSNGDLRIASKRESGGANCVWVNGDDWFSPAKSWQQCGTGEWSSGTNKVTIVSGNLWPLKDGAKAVYKKVPTSSTGRVGTEETRKCEVIGSVSIQLFSEDFDAMKIVCKTRKWDNTVDTRVWYWTEEHREIKYRRTNNKKGVIDEFELVVAAQ